MDITIVAKLPPEGVPDARGLVYPEGFWEKQKVNLEKIKDFKIIDHPDIGWLLETKKDNHEHN